MPYIKPDSERGPIGSWLRQQREDRNWSVGEVVERLEADYGITIREDYYRQLEAGPNRVPSPQLLRAFGLLFESEPDWEAPLRGMHRVEALRVPVERAEYGRKSLTDDPVVAQLIEMYRDQQRVIESLRQEVMVLAATVERLRDRVPA